MNNDFGLFDFSDEYDAREDARQLAKEVEDLQAKESPLRAQIKALSDANGKLAAANDSLRKERDAAYILLYEFATAASLIDPEYILSLSGKAMGDAVRLIAEKARPTLAMFPKTSATPLGTKED